MEKNPIDRGLEGKSLEEIQNIVIDRVISIFPSSHLENFIRTEGIAGETISTITSKAVRATCNGGGFFYDAPQNGNRFGSLMCITQFDHESVIVNETKGEVFMRLLLNPQSLQEVLSDILVSGEIEKAEPNLAYFLGDIKKLLGMSGKNDNKKELITYSLKSNKNGLISFIGSNLGN